MEVQYRGLPHLPIDWCKMIAGYDQTWIDTDDLRIMTCRLTCGYAD